MKIGDYISDVFNDEYLIAKIRVLDWTKGIENDLRFLFEKSFYKREGKVPETEVGERIDLKLPLEPIHWIEMTCYKGVLTEESAKNKIKKDIEKLSKKDNTSKRIFIYFGLYGKKQPPYLKKDYSQPKRIKEIEEEIKTILDLARSIHVEIEKHEDHKLTSADRIIYAAWFYLK